MRLLLSITAVFYAVLSFAQIIPKQVYPSRYICQRTSDAITVDGNDKESTWTHAHPLKPFVDIEGHSKPLPSLKTEVKMAWDDQNLYVFVWMEEPHLWAELTEHDDIIWHENDIELFFDPDQDTHNYMEFEYNALGTLLDLYLVKPYRDGGPMLIEWDAKGVQSAVKLDGTLNDGTDTDAGWSLELSIPFQALKTHKNEPNPQNGTRWRMNLSRVQWDIEWSAQEYKKKRDNQGQQLPEHNWVWSPQGIVNMHYPEQWGYMQFSSDPAGADTAHFYFVEGDAEREWLRKVYYAERLCKSQTDHYTGSFEELLEYSRAFEGVMEYLHLVKTQTGYQCSMKMRDEWDRWIIDETGRITKQ